jgi:hypothetical protein
MDSKKEMLAASILAISLAIGLGAMSYALFTSGPTTAKPTLDAFARKAGQGASISSGNFEPLDNVSIYAHVTQGGKNLQNCPVAFTIQRPDGTQILRTALTNDSGIAETDLSLLPSEGPIIGTWQVLANATIDNEVIKDAFDFQCASQGARIDVYSLKDGVPSISFLPNDTVLLEAQLSYGNASIAGAPVTFEIIAPNSTVSLRTAVTNSLGIANVTFRFPSTLSTSSNVSSRIWQVVANSTVDNQSVHGGTSFGLFTVTPELDVFIQNGGVGSGAPSENFVLNETVTLYEEVRDDTGQLVPKWLVDFSITGPSGATFLAGALTTNASGIANATFRIPYYSAYVGTYHVYANANAPNYEELRISDTLTFEVSEP